MLGLYQQDASDAYDALARQPAAGAFQPSTLAGTLTAVPRGIGSGLAKVGETLADSQSGMAVETAKEQGISPDQALIQQQSAEGGYVPPSALDPANFKAQEMTPDEWLAHQRAGTRQVVDAFKPDPVTTGAAGQAMFGLSDAITRFMAGGPEIAGISEFASRNKELEAQGVTDKKTRYEIAAIDASVLSIGGVSPMAFGKGLGQKVFTGVLTNEALGAVSTASTAKLLNDAGYTAQAKQYDVLDAQSNIANAVLGLAFGVHAHLVHASPSVVDAALTQADAAHAEASAPGVPVDPISRSNHVDNLNAAAEALISGGDLPAMKPVETIANPAQDALQVRSEAAVESAAREVTGEAPAAPREGEQRQDLLDRARIVELRDKMVDTDLTPAETRELADLQHRELQSSYVGDRRVNGVQNLRGYNEMLQRGEAEPHQYFLDADMFKDINTKFGHSTGDEAIHTIANTLAHYFPPREDGVQRAFHRSGDEFYAQHSDREAGDRAMAALTRDLQNHTLRAFDAEGNVVAEQKGIGVSHGVGSDIEQAAAGLKRDKAARAAAGLRAERDAQPGAVPEKPAAGSGEGARAETAGSEAAKLDEPTRQATEQAQQILDRLPDFNITDENGVERPAKDVLADALAGVKDAATDAELHTVAAACFGRG